jgi:hypothetical protein
MKTLALSTCVLLITAATRVIAQSPTPDASLYGPYPTSYKNIVMKWLNAQLIDPMTVRIEWNGEPKPADLGKNGKHLYGYVVYFKVNARNQFGTYTGFQKHGALIRDGEVVKGLGFGY